MDLLRWFRPRSLQPDVVDNDTLRRMVESIPFDAPDRKRLLFDKLDAAHRFKAPQDMVEQELDTIWRVVMADHKAGNIDPTDVGKSPSQLRSEYREIADRRVRLGLVVAEIGLLNGLGLTDAEKATLSRDEQAPYFEEVVAYIFSLAPPPPNASP